MTVKGPEGRMTKPLVTPYAVGDVVMLTVTSATLQDGCEPHVTPETGDTGVIREIELVDPEEGDAGVDAEGDIGAFLMFDVEWPSGTYPVGDDQIMPVSDAAWLRRLLGGLDKGDA
jgi:hypothetical protein